MKRKRSRAFVSALLSCVVIAGCGESSKVQQDAKELEALETAKDAYIYAYPLVTMEMTRRASTNVAAPEGTFAPDGPVRQAARISKRFLQHSNRPERGHLYTVVWFDVSKEPWVVSIPDLKGRYALFPMLDGWTTCSRCPANAPPALERRNMPSPGRAGAERCPLA